MADITEKCVNNSQSATEDESKKPNTLDDSSSSSSSTSSSDEDESIKSKKSEKLDVVSKKFDHEDESIKSKESEKLDVLSEKFDPLSALYCKDMSMIRNIVQGAPVLDNVEVFAARYYGKGGSKAQGKANATNCGGVPAQGSISNTQGSVEPPKRVFTAEQMPIEGKKKEFNNVLKFMKKQSEKGGPMAMLQNRIETGRRIKIFIRGILKFRVMSKRGHIITHRIIY